MENYAVKAKMHRYGIIKKSDLIILFTVLSTFEVSYLSYISMPIKILYIACQSLLIVYALLKIWLGRKILSTDFLVVLFVVIECFSTIGHVDEIYEFILNTKLVLLLYVSFRYYFALNPKFYLKAMSGYLFALTVLNTVSAIVCYPKGLFYYDQYAPGFIIGADNTSTRVYIVSIVFCFAYHAINRINKTNKKDIIPILSLANFTVFVFLRDVGNGKLCALIFIAAYFAFNVLNVHLPRMPLKKIIVGNYILFLLVVIWNKLDLFSFIIVNILHRDLTLTTRTTIWEITINKIISKPVLGNGYISGTEFESMLPSIIGINAHNTILMIAFIGGISLSIVYFAILWRSIRIYDENVLNERLWMIPVSFLAMFLRSQVEGGDAAFLIGFVFLIYSFAQCYIKEKRTVEDELNEFK